MEDIKNWLTSEMDYFQGVEIFAKYCPNKIFVRNFQRGNVKMHGKKLEYEMKRLLKIPLTVITNQTCSNQQLINQLKAPSPLERAGGEAQITKSAIPSIISQAKELRNDLYKNIALIHNQLYDLGEENDDKTVSKRKTLLDKRIPLIEKHEQIYQAIEEFFLTEIIPDNLNTLIAENQIVTTEETTNYETLSDIELVKTKNRLASRITKQKNLLKFQTFTAQKEANPMPESPKRKEAEQKLKELTADYKKITQLIKTRTNAI